MRTGLSTLKVSTLKGFEVRCHLCCRYLRLLSGKYMAVVVLKRTLESSAWYWWFLVVNLMFVSIDMISCRRTYLAILIECSCKSTWRVLDFWHFLCSQNFVLFFCTDAIDQPAAVQGNSNRRSVSTLKPCAKDAYMLFQVVGEHIFIYLQLSLGVSTSL